MKLFVFLIKQFKKVLLRISIWTICKLSKIVQTAQWPPKYNSTKKLPYFFNIFSLTGRIWCCCNDRYYGLCTKWYIKYCLSLLWLGSGGFSSRSPLPSCVLAYNYAL